MFHFFCSVEFVSKKQPWMKMRDLPGSCYTTREARDGQTLGALEIGVQPTELSPKHHNGKIYVLECRRLRSNMARRKFWQHGASPVLHVCYEDFLASGFYVSGIISSPRKLLKMSAMVCLHSLCLMARMFFP